MRGGEKSSWLNALPPVSPWSACFLLLFARRIFSDIFAGSKILVGNAPAGPPPHIPPQKAAHRSQGKAVQRPRLTKTHGREARCCGERPGRGSLRYLAAHSMPDSHHFGALDFVGVAAIALVDLDPRSPGSRKCLKKQC